MIEDINIEELVKDRAKFNAFVYTPVGEAVKEINERRNDKSIKDFSFVPESFKNEPRAVMFRQVVTPNYEISRFLSIVGLSSFSPLFLEYHEDKFTSNNEFKHSLGKLFFYKGRGKDGSTRVDSLNVVDFNRVNGKKISLVRTIWGQSLIDFHHELFAKKFKKLKNVFFDASLWFLQNGNGAKEYYKSFLSLFIKNGILFENFLLDCKELSFTEEIFLPAFISVYKETGKKPLIVALEPTEIEEDRFWISHSYEEKILVEYKMASIFGKIFVKLRAWI